MDDGARLVGSPLERREDTALLTGLARYTADLAPTEDLHLEFVRSRYAHANVTGVDTSAADGMVDVVATYTRADLEASGAPCVLPVRAGATDVDVAGHPVLAHERVRYQGQPVAAVIAVVVRYVTVDDCGLRINPRIVEGQVHGGVAQGFGQALLDRARYNDAGNLVTGWLQDYALPRTNDVPDPETGATVTPSPYNPLGVKGVGEAGAIAAPPALVNAVGDALAPLGVRHVDTPLTDERVWRAIRGARVDTDAG